MSVVIDSSVAVAWVMPDEDVDGVHAIFEEVKQAGAGIPTLWWTEVANALCYAEKKCRIDSAFQAKAMLQLSKITLRTDAETVEHAWGTTLALAKKHQLTCYDATYLELAIRKSAKLATFDHDLANAAKIEGITVL